MSKSLPINPIQIRSHWTSLSADRHCSCGVTKSGNLFLLWRSQQGVTPSIYFGSLWKGAEKSLGLRRNIEWIYFLLGMRREVYAHTSTKVNPAHAVRHGGAAPTAGWLGWFALWDGSLLVFMLYFVLLGVGLHFCILFCTLLAFF